MVSIKEVRNYMEEIKTFVKQNKDHIDEKTYNKNLMNKLEICCDMIEGIPSPSMREKMNHEFFAFIGFCLSGEIL